MNEYSLSEEDLHVLDIIINLEPFPEYEISGFWLTKDQSFTTEQLTEILNRLSHLQLISSKKDEYQRPFYSINPLMREKIKTMLSAFWEQRKIEKDKLISKVEKDYATVLKLLDFKSTIYDKSQIGFSDYYTDSQSQQFCERLTEDNMVFKHTWSSKKHDYMNYYLRRVPFSVEEILKDFVISTANIDGLKLETDWRTLVILLFSEANPTVEDLVANFPASTLDEIKETLFRLEKRRILFRKGTELSILKTTKDLVKNYFILNRYQYFKTQIIQDLRNRIKERTSSLYLLGLAKRILTSVGFQELSEPFCSIKRASIKTVNDDDLMQIAKLGIVFLTAQEIIVASEILLELEEVLKSDFSEQALYRVPADEIFTAISVWKEIFGKCEDYIKIEDEYVNEQTLEIIQSYSPVGVKLTILSSLKGARSFEIEEIERRIKAIKDSGRKIEFFFVGYERNEESPFHERYIISKNVCYLLSNSMKQIGKSKSASIAAISTEKKTGTIEPSFNYWIECPREKLKELGIIRMTIDEWLKHKSAA